MSATHQTRPILVEAMVWNQHGDHVAVGLYERGEGVCNICEGDLLDHGFVDGGIRDRVCPGDWIVTDDQGATFSLRPDDFAERYEAIPP